MSEKSIGIENLQEAVKFGCEFGSQIMFSMRDGKITLWEGIKLIPELKSLPGIIKKGDDLKNEILDLSEDEVLEIKNYVNNNLDLDGDVAEWVDWSFRLIALMVDMPALK